LALFISVVCIYFFYRSFMMLSIVLGVLVLAFTLPLPWSEPLVEGPNASSSSSSSNFDFGGNSSSSGYGDMGSNLESSGNGCYGGYGDREFY
jgi:uncharacterized membrane protein YgcG